MIGYSEEFFGSNACGTRATFGGGFPGRLLLFLSSPVLFCLCCVFFYSLLCAYINLVIGFHPECAIDSMFK